jgi:uncharacterized membrane protein YkoI
VGSGGIVSVAIAVTVRYPAKAREVNISHSKFIHPPFRSVGLGYGMVQRCLSILVLITVLALPGLARASHAVAGPGVWRGERAEQVVPRVAAGKWQLAQSKRNKQRKKNRRDHDRARDAVSAGDVLPLRQIMQSVGRRYPGRLLDANLGQNRQGRWIYRIKLLAPRDQVRRLTVDAKSGRVLQGGR